MSPGPVSDAREAPAYVSAAPVEEVLHMCAIEVHVLEAEWTAGAVEVESSAGVAAAVPSVRESDHTAGADGRHPRTADPSEASVRDGRSAPVRPPSERGDVGPARAS